MEKIALLIRGLYFMNLILFDHFCNYTVETNIQKIFFIAHIEVKFEIGSIMQG